MVNNGFLAGKRMEFSRKHHTVCPQVPFFHVFGTIVVIMTSLYYASTIVLPTDGYQPDKTLDAMKKEKYIVVIYKVRLYWLKI